MILMQKAEMFPFLVFILKLVLGKRYNPELKTITGMQKDKLSYICYDFKNPEINFEVMLK
jgi:hypothetical protein